MAQRAMLAASLLTLSSAVTLHQASGEGDAGNPWSAWWSGLAPGAAAGRPTKSVPQPEARAEEPVIKELTPGVCTDPLLRSYFKTHNRSSKAVGKGTSKTKDAAALSMSEIDLEQLEAEQDLELLRFASTHLGATSKRLQEASRRLSRVKLCDRRIVETQLTAWPSAGPLGRCALVGSSLDMSGRGLGREIDSHDTVIRVNRVPTPEYKKDFGKRTDVFFTAPVQDFREQFGSGGQAYKTFGGTRKLCPYAGGCPFKSVVLKGSDSPECGVSFEKRFPPTQPGWAPALSSVSVAHQSEAVNSLAYRLIDFDAVHRRPTNGFQAFLTFAVTCRSLDVYGFSGNRSIDDHWMKTVHDVRREHRIIREVVNGSTHALLEQVFPAYAECLASKRGSIRVH